MLGIPDLRYPQNESRSGSGTKENELINRFSTSTFEEMVLVLLDGAHLSEKIMNKTLIYYRTQDVRSEKMVSMLITRYQEHFNNPLFENVLDLGCGSGGAAGSLSKRFRKIFSIDEDMVQLILAKKYFEEKHIDNVVLICARAQALPFSNASFDYVQAINLIEHLEDAIHQVIQEIYRTLKIGSGFAADSRNRFDIFMPEPHSGIRFLGFLPRKLIPNFVRRTTGNHYLSTRLLSYRELASVARKTFTHFKIVLPILEAYGQSERYDKVLKTLEKFDLLKILVLRCISTHILVARKQNLV